MAASVFLYLHVPKTAGVSVKTFLEHRFDEDSVYHVTAPDFLASERTLFEKPLDERQKIALVAGHFSYGIHEAFDRPSFYYSILREPLDRVASLYYFINTSERHPRHSAVSKMTLSEFALSSMHPEIENCQTKMISGRDETNFIEGTQPCSEIDFERAKDHITKSFVGVGIYEQLNLSLFMLCRRMGWSFPTARVSRLNRTRSRRKLSELTGEETEILRSVNQFDTKLYEYARSLFTKSLADLSVSERVRYQLLAGNSTMAAASSLISSALGKVRARF